MGHIPVGLVPVLLNEAEYILSPVINPAPDAHEWASIATHSFFPSRLAPDVAKVTVLVTAPKGPEEVIGPDACHNAFSLGAAVAGGVPAGTGRLLG